MTLDLKSENSFYVFDSYGMLTVKSDELSWRDSVGMTVCAWIAYGRPLALSMSLENCWDSISNTLFRHPKYKELASRDHMSYYLIWIKLYASNVIGFYVSSLGKQRGMSLWMHSLTGNKWAERAYYMIYIPGAIIGNVWLRICRWIGRIKPERNNNWWILKDDYPNWYFLLKNRTKWQKLWAWIIFITIPAYPLHNRGWQLYVMPDSKRKERLKQIFLRRVGKSNILVRLLLGDMEISQQDVDNYPFMTGFRPGVYLDETCRRTIRELTAVESEYNTYEKDLIQWLWNLNGETMKNVQQ